MFLILGTTWAYALGYEVFKYIDDPTIELRQLKAELKELKSKCLVEIIPMPSRR